LKLTENGWCLWPVVCLYDLKCLVLQNALPEPVPALMVLWNILPEPPPALIC